MTPDELTELSQLYERAAADAATIARLLRAQAFAERQRATLDALRGEPLKLANERDSWKARAEKAEARVVGLEAQLAARGAK